MIEGWLLDVHQNENSNGMVAWLVDDEGRSHRCDVTWAPVLHVHASLHELEQLEHWLLQPEIAGAFFIQTVEWTKLRLDLERHDLSMVLEVHVERFHRLRGLAEHIEARGDFHRYTLYSVDAHFVQRFLNEHGCTAFQRVVWNPLLPQNLQAAGGVQREPPFHVMSLTVDFVSTQTPPSVHDGVRMLRLATAQHPGLATTASSPRSIELRRDDFDSMQAMLQAFQFALRSADPDVLLTQGGDQRLFPWLAEQAELHGIALQIGRSAAPLTRSTNDRTIRSYGQTRHRHGAFFLEGRLHLDLRNSFIVKEGGLAGLFELAQQSCQSAQIISRLSPGSVISAIQMRVAMDDGVLVPWKKNRPEDTKSALELLHADRGGLYLDSRPGVYASVIELDFASLFPSIIATRNISPETLNCSCCQPQESPSTGGFVPLPPDDAVREFRERGLRSRFGHGLFPLAHEKALRVPGLSSYTCGRTHGFLGRVVAPLIHRRQELKARRTVKGDAFDLRQNALKWLLVTCFGYTGYRNARFGRIEAHEAICAWSREILLSTIQAAQNEGWEVLHAIVDCVWLADTKGRNIEQQRTDAEAFAHRVSQSVGIPLEFEQHYDFIAFLPSRMHGSGSLTKYWAYGGGSFKVRGIEMRQHSTPPWIRSLQEHALAILVEGGRSAGIPDRDAQRKVLHFYHEEVRRLQQRMVPLNDLVLTRRVSKELGDYRVKNLTFAALMRAHQQGVHVPPGGKVRYVVANAAAPDLLDRVILVDELPLAKEGISGCPSHYGALAERAIWAVLAPFGWTDTMLQDGQEQPTLLDFIPAHAEEGVLQRGSSPVVR